MIHEHVGNFWHCTSDENLYTEYIELCNGAKTFMCFFNFMYASILDRFMNGRPTNQSKSRIWNFDWLKKMILNEENSLPNLVDL